MKKGQRIKSYLTYHPRITGTLTIIPAIKQILEVALPKANYESIYKVSIVLVNIHVIRILIQKVIIGCVISASHRCVFKIILVTRFKIQLFFTLKSCTY